jgi:SAM-dependent methyltransferase
MDRRSRDQIVPDLIEQFLIWGKQQGMQIITSSLYLAETDFRFLLEKLGPSLGLWRAAEIAALREQAFEHPVLDLGCGDGLITSQVLSKVDIGLDPDSEALQRADRLGIYGSFQTAFAEHAVIQPESVATIISNSVLEHIFQIDKTLQVLSDALRPGGRLIFTAPTEAFNQWLALPNQAYADWRNRHFVHLNVWSLVEWESHLRQAGFEIEVVRPYLRRVWVTAWDWLELIQMVRLGKRRIAGAAWKKMPRSWITWLSERGARTDLSANEPGGGRLISARKC